MDWERAGENGPSLWVVVCGQGARHQPEMKVRDVQAESESFPARPRTARPLGESLEERSGATLGKAGTAIANPDLRAAGRRVERQVHGATGRRELDGIVQNIHERLLQQI
jgi:hypothetical protein